MRACACVCVHVHLCVFVCDCLVACVGCCAAVVTEQNAVCQEVMQKCSTRDKFKCVRACLPSGPLTQLIYVVVCVQIYIWYYSVFIIYLLYYGLYITCVWLPLPPLPGSLAWTLHCCLSGCRALFTAMYDFEKYGTPFRKGGAAAHVRSLAQGSWREGSAGMDLLHYTHTCTHPRTHAPTHACTPRSSTYIGDT